LRHRDCFAEVVPRLLKRAVSCLVIALRRDIIRGMRSGIFRACELRIGFARYYRSTTTAALSLYRVFEHDIIYIDIISTFNTYAHVKRRVKSCFQRIG
jgi:hypothetical protein